MQWVPRPNKSWLFFGNEKRSIRKRAECYRKISITNFLRNIVRKYCRISVRLLVNYWRKRNVVPDKPTPIRASVFAGRLSAASGSMSFGEEIAKRERKSYAGFPAVGEADSSTRIPCDGYGRSRSLNNWIKSRCRNWWRICGLLSPLLSSNLGIYTKC